MSKREVRLDPSVAATSGLSLPQFQSLYGDARRFAAFIAQTASEPDDLVQEALARVLARGPVELLDDPLTYLRKTMLNIVRNEHRRRGRESRAYARAAARTDQLAPSDMAESLDAAMGILALLPATSRAAVLLVDLEGRSIEEAATLLGLSAAANRKRLSRARRSLRDSLVEVETNG
jgi:RNA polymerase sigma factor (sigma-70 family)